jgi:hypothetical protein
MNKLLLVGNGFDLAHGLPTSYRDFLNDFWMNINFNHNNEECTGFIFINKNYLKIVNFKKKVTSFGDFQENLVSYQNQYSNDIEPYGDHLLRTRKNEIVFKFNR